jgi:hypothetical protein
LTPNPIRKVLSTLRSHRVRFLLIGGQACVFYGAAEFSRDADIVLLPDPANLKRLAAAIRGLDGERIAVPPFSAKYLKKGHAVHFRCRHPEAKGIRIDVMAVLRNVPSFRTLWKRRTTVETSDGEVYDLLSLPDLVQAKKTQRDKDWPMLRRLVESHHLQHRRSPTRDQVRFWLCEARTPAILTKLARAYPREASAVARRRPAVALAISGAEDELGRALKEEEERERELDRRYWDPLKKELRALRRRAAQSARR